MKTVILRYTETRARQYMKRNGLTYRLNHRGRVRLGKDLEHGVNLLMEVVPDEPYRADRPRSQRAAI